MIYTTMKEVAGLVGISDVSLSFLIRTGILPPIDSRRGHHDVTDEWLVETKKILEERRRTINERRANSIRKSAMKNDPDKWKLPGFYKDFESY